MATKRGIADRKRAVSRYLRRLRHIYLSSKIWRRRLVFWVGALLTGYVAVAFAEAANEAQALFRRISAVSPFLPLVLTPAVLALSAWTARRYFPGSEGSGIPQTIAARHHRDGDLRSRLLSLKVAAGKVLLCLLGLFGGASIGREGPTVQVGAAIMLGIAKASGLGREPGLILAGSAAGVAAAFNTPLAGIVFAIEEMSRAYEQRISSLVLIAVVLAGIASLSVFGYQTYFGVSTAALGPARDWIVVVVAGGLCGAIGASFSRLVVLAMRMLPTMFGGHVKSHPVTFAAICGLLLAIIGLAAGGTTYGTGYEQARIALAGNLPEPWQFAPLKLAATLISSICGIPGGLFAPSLSVGAGLGAGIAQWFPATPVGAVVLLCMVGYFAGVVQAPMTAFVIVMEMSGDQAMLIPLMASAVIAYGVSRSIMPVPLYHALAERFAHRPTGT